MMTIALVAEAPGWAQVPPQLQTAVLARAIQPGEVVRLAVMCDCGDLRPRATAFGTDIALFPSAGTTWHGLVGIDLDIKAGVYPLTVAIRGSEPRLPDHTTDLHVVAKAFPTRRLQVAAGFVDPPASDLERIAREATSIARLFEEVTPRLWDGPFLPPVVTRATGNFGARSLFNGQPRSPHAGIDFNSPAGTPVAAPAAGRVVLADELFFTGNTVIVDHGVGLFSLLAHLSTMTVAPGDPVQRGTIVGRVGATGRATGPHLHWGVRLNGARVDPLSLLVATGPVPAR